MSKTSSVVMLIGVAMLQCYTKPFFDLLCDECRFSFFSDLEPLNTQCIV